MLAEFLLRLAIALPIVCGLAAASLFAVKRGWVRLPAFAGLSPGRRPASGHPDAALAILSVKSLSPAARIAVVGFGGRELLIGVSGQSVSLLAERETAAAIPAAAHLERAP